MNFILKVMKKWLPLAVLATGLCALVYLAVQQSLRSNANDPQIQIARDAAHLLTGGGRLDVPGSGAKVDISQSLAPFTIQYDAAGNVQASSAELHGSTPALPSGVLENARQNGENRVTWQPETGVRIAAVIVAYKDGFVLAGRSLLEVEKREDQAEFESGIFLLLIWVATFITLSLLEMAGLKNNQHSPA